MLRKIRELTAHNSKLTGRDFIYAILSGILLTLAFPQADFWPLAWVAFVPLFFAAHNKSAGKAFLLGYITGIVFWAGTIYWLINVTLPGLVILVIYLAFFLAIFAAIFSILARRQLPYIFMFVSSAWVLLEYIRSHLFTGFPWALLAYSQYTNLELIQAADINGVWGISFIVMTGNIVAYNLVRRKFNKRLLVPLAFLLIVLSYGHYKINHWQKMLNGPSVRIAVIQPNIAQALKWQPGLEGFIMDRQISLTMVSLKHNPDLVIWPEAALPSVYGEDERYYAEAIDLSAKIKKPLLLGAVNKRGDDYYNSADLIDAQGRFILRYDKLHLVPFGEYIPLRGLFPFLEGIVPIADFTAGSEYTVFSLREGRFAVLICFEDLFPELARQFSRRGAQFLVNITNDAWFGRSSAARQHLAASVFRAVENRTFVVRAANTGISGFISPYGKISSLVSDSSGKDIFISGYGLNEVFLPQKSPTGYQRRGDIAIIICILLLVYAIFLLRRASR